MVDVNTQNKTISVNVSSSGVSSNVNASGDTSHYYSEKAREWAISNRIVDGVDYSSKYYAGRANQSALNAQSFAQSAQDSYKQFQDSVDGALSNVDSAVQGAITTIDTKSGEAIDSINSTKTDILTDIEFIADGEKQEIQDLADEIKDNGDIINAAIEAGVERLNSIDSLKNNQITNCLLEVPQRIKLELNSESSLVLKAGSEYIVPNGFEDDGVTPRFDYVTTDIDIQQGNGHATQDVYFVRNYSSPKYLIGFHATNCFSGNTAPTGFGTYAFWYDTANNLVKWTSDSGATWTSGYSLPVCLTTGSSATVITSIDQVFNGMGYIGNTEWLDKGVKGLIPNGRNEDGTLRNIEITTDKVYTYSVSAWADNMVTYFDLTLNIFNCGYNFVISETQPADSVIYSMWYQPSTNLIRWHGGEDSGWEFHDVLILGNHNRAENPTNGVITSSQPKQPFRAVDYSDKPQISGWAMPSKKRVHLTLGASGTIYKAPANGYFAIRKVAGGAGQVIRMFGGGEFGSSVISYANGNNLETFVPIAKGEDCTIYYTATGATETFMFVYAEGEV